MLVLCSAPKIGLCLPPHLKHNILKLEVWRRTGRLLACFSFLTLMNSIMILVSLAIVWDIASKYIIPLPPDKSFAKKLGGGKYVTFFKVMWHPRRTCKRKRILGLKWERGVCDVDRQIRIKIQKIS